MRSLVEILSLWLWKNTSSKTAPTEWTVSFLSKPPPNQPLPAPGSGTRRALIILNQPFSRTLLHYLWWNTDFHCCADGGANRLYDIHDGDEDERQLFKPDFINGDLDSLRDDVKDYYSSLGVPVIRDPDQYTTDLMKCKKQIEDMETDSQRFHEIVILGGLSGRLDQTVHTLSYLHKLRKDPHRIFAVTDDSIAWVLDEGEHNIHIDHSVLGPTCGLLPVGVGSMLLSTKGLRWNLDNAESSFDGLISTSNQFLPSEDTVWVKISRPICWTAELRPTGTS